MAASKASLLETGKLGFSPLPLVRLKSKNVSREWRRCNPELEFQISVIQGSTREASSNRFRNEDAGIMVVEMYSSEGDGRAGLFSCIRTSTVHDLGEPLLVWSATQKLRSLPHWLTHTHTQPTLLRLLAAHRSHTNFGSCNCSAAGRAAAQVWSGQFAPLQHYCC
ncbi:hypothetical protein BDZ85DRAFT_15677 [Elsinoe ampelina]|uniref:Uncharacterized protein n=1 Tax=Elsinoe ampelina TaxID=302913 RepID=A0A6A6G7D9_9PEZI|nr:hypothetical protein BDZ85DRAFT_15677 [Elsinoe ampelina]